MGDMVTHDEVGCKKRKMINDYQSPAETNAGG
jgi:hypothetical protein